MSYSVPRNNYNVHRNLSRPIIPDLPVNVPVREAPRKHSNRAMVTSMAVCALLLIAGLALIALVKLPVPAGVATGPGQVTEIR
jgi:hypothetical protein